VTSLRLIRLTVRFVSRAAAASGNGQITIQTNRAEHATTMLMLLMMTDNNKITGSVAIGWIALVIIFIKEEVKCQNVVLIQ
jgi:hypothetical protein